MSNMVDGHEFKPIIRSRKATEERLWECLATWVKSEMEIDFIQTPGRKMATYSGTGDGPEYIEFIVSDPDLVQCAKKMLDAIYGSILLNDIATRKVGDKFVRATHIAWRIEPEIIRSSLFADNFKCYTRFILLDSSEIVSELETINE